MIQYADITLYSDVPLDVEKNKLVEGISDFLNAYSNVTKRYNYFKDEMETEIAFENNELFWLNFEQSNVASVKSENYNYIKVVPIAKEGNVTASGFPRYYFVTGFRWTGEKVVRLSLYMDVLNTFPIGTGYTFGQKSHTVRRHQPRFEIVTITDIKSFVLDSERTAIVSLVDPAGRIAANASAFLVPGHPEGMTIRGGPYYLGNVVQYEVTGLSPSQRGELSITAAFAVGSVNRYPEGLSPVLYKTEETRVLDTYDVGWNLIYRNKNDINPAAVQNVNPVECLLLPDKTVPIRYYSHDVLPAQMEATNFYTVSAQVNGNTPFSIVANGQKICDVNHTGTSWIWFNSVDRWAYLYAEGGGIYVVSIWQGNTVGGYIRTGKKYGPFAAIQFSGIGDVNYNIGIFSDYPLYGKDKVYEAGISLPTTPAAGMVFSATKQIADLQGIDSLDRTDNRLIKVIKLPYSPVYFPLDGVSHALSVPEGWSYTQSGNLLTLDDPSKKFSRTFYAHDETAAFIPDPSRVLSSLVPVGVDPSAVRDDSHETKIFHSDFYFPKFVYDSFGMGFALEQVDAKKRKGFSLQIRYVVTSTINSKFLFMFPDYIDSLKFTTEDYPGTLPVSRNNEETLFNSQYINYIRNGYNYDLKNKEQQQFAAGLGLIGNVAAMGAGVAAGNPMGVLMGGAGAAGNVASIIAGEQQIEQKLLQAKMQAVSVSGSDDVDLMEAYSGNRAKMCLYQVSPRVREALLDLFYLYGYVADEYGVPETETRYWFDFLQGDMVIIPVDHIPQNMQNEIRNRYAAGVTIFHQHSGWDIEQTKENWERGLVLQ